MRQKTFELAWDDLKKLKAGSGDVLHQPPLMCAALPVNFCQQVNFSPDVNKRRPGWLLFTRREMFTGKSGGAARPLSPALPPCMTVPPGRRAALRELRGVITTATRLHLLLRRAEAQGRSAGEGKGEDVFPAQGIRFGGACPTADSDLWHLTPQERFE